MIVTIDGEELFVNVDQLKSELTPDEYEFVSLDDNGELVIDLLAHGPHYAYRREVWQLVENGIGTEWAGYVWEFCHSIKMESETA